MSIHVREQMQIVVLRSGGVLQVLVPGAGTELGLNTLHPLLPGTHVQMPLELCQLATSGGFTVMLKDTEDSSLGSIFDNSQVYLFHLNCTLIFNYRTRSRP